MARETVEVVGVSAASPEAVWSVVSDFCGQWHPAIATIYAEHDARGTLVRAFTAHGEGTVYREQLTWLSDSDRTLAYTHLEGIAGAQSYDGRIAIGAGDHGGSTLRWSARVEAASPRLQAICEGTKAIFEAGIAALSETTLATDAAEQPRPLPASAATRDIVIDGEPRLALTTTDSDGPLCLFLHGIGGSRGNWLPQLAAAGGVMRAAALDLRGYGDSALGRMQSTVGDYCDDILRVKEELGADRLVLVGLSLGSWIATSFAMRHPEMLAGLVLSGGCTGMSEASLEERETFRVSRKVPLDAGQTPADFAPTVVEVLAGPNASDAVKEQLFRSMAAIPSATYRDALVCFTNPSERFDFSRLTMPVLMMTGEHDRLASPSEIRGVAGRILDQAFRPDIRYETIADAGHVCNVEQPAAYSRILLDFLRKLPR
ncbi:MAG: alpha/beta fold hydrolase [Mesorhizobium sp.]|uniref:alpha/beta fold hydrolase n=5 Tax=Mesorhizobium TaxID=68287 RepID=UPI000F759D75|nr:MULTISPECIES: alpha/beta fold hydrolase [unclassified Mesorhizobium]RVD70307.1 alpha/beta fold hydrolase [Mesorhizobium sp. M4A.F.Ca.ET.029.04.2.1]AZO48721.1 alpha/beta fold hydrolase [Mesorhizobium sp. M4B.F.Ca.ET.058.02.1.1]RVC41566.1 alpha/beta fold hydrolase [Mesorhizobium sp. M4A.F.Ca.ET.090.04.2.1]RVC83077.1 alpha/beta fold hydrolase [Mesorhizobium sp. M4A.F.Ca.ET.022.05.2.1]RWC58489.1 MAG: alpha/beta fold hydrolase [Mesorhizobium sp.]